MTTIQISYNEKNAMAKKTIDPSYDDIETLEESLTYAKKCGEDELNGLFSVVPTSTQDKLKKRYGISSRNKNLGKAFINMYINEYYEDGVEYEDFYSQVMNDINEINEENAYENGQEKIRNLLSKYDKKTIGRFMNSELDLVNILLSDYLDRTPTHLSGIDDYCDELAKKLDKYK